MQSQEDIFATQEPSNKGKYGFVVLCDKDESVMNPFAVYPRTMFSSVEINERWLDSILDHSSRLRTLPTLERFPNMSLCLFGKIDDGGSF